MESESNTYYAYAVSEDWYAYVQGDSLRPVYFEPKVKIHKQVDEGILVFEIPVGHRIDSLIYNDSYNNWGVQKIF